MTRALAMLALLPALAACEFGEEPVAPGRARVVVHGVMNPFGPYYYYVLVERTLTGRVEAREGPFDPDDPIASGGGEPVTGATVRINGATGIELVTLRADGKGRGVYRFRNQPPPSIGTPVGDELVVTRGRTYALTVTTPDGHALTASTFVPTGPFAPDTLDERSFDREQESYPFAWARADQARSYVLQIQSPYGPFQLFTPDTAVAITGDLRNLDAAWLPRVFVPGFRQALQVLAVDTNYYDWYRSASNPFTGLGLISHVRGGTGVFGALYPLRTIAFEVVAPTDDPLEGRWYAATSGGPVLDLYLGEPALASGRWQEGATRRGVLGTRDGGRLTLALLRAASAADTLDVLTGERRGTELVLRGRDGVERTFRRTAAP